MVLNDVVFDAEGIFHRPQSKHFFQADAGKPWLSGFCPRGEEKLIISLLKGLSVFQITDRNTFSFRMERNHLMMHLHRDPKAGEEAFRCLERQFFRNIDHPA